VAAKRASTKRPKITVTWTGEIIPACDRKLARMMPVAMAEVDDLASEALQIARSLAPQATGRYKAALGMRRQTVGRRQGVDVKSYSPHAALVEKGRKAGGIPPLIEIATVYQITEKQAYPIAQAIARKGTKGKRVMSKTRGRMRGQTLGAHIRLGEWLNNLDAP
jgi:hypothetical protein